MDENSGQEGLKSDPSFNINPIREMDNGYQQHERPPDGTSGELQLPSVQAENNNDTKPEENADDTSFTSANPEDSSTGILDRDLPVNDNIEDKLGFSDASQHHLSQTIDKHHPTESNQMAEESLQGKDRKAPKENIESSDGSSCDSSKVHSMFLICYMFPSVRHLDNSKRVIHVQL